MRIIDADKLKSHCSWWTDEALKSLVYDLVDAQPTVDLDEAFRCNRISADLDDPDD